jgi:3-hydroxy-3-methylglutaryl CoA synthase
MAGIVDGPTHNFKPWKEHAEAQTYVKNLDTNLVKPTWGILYCGGKNASLLSILEKVAEDVGIKMHAESYAW